MTALSRRALLAAFVATGGSLWLRKAPALGKSACPPFVVAPPLDAYWRAAWHAAEQRIAAEFCAALDGHLADTRALLQLYRDDVCAELERVVAALMPVAPAPRWPAYLPPPVLPKTATAIGRVAE